MIDNKDNWTDNVTGTELMYQNLQFAICTKPKLYWQWLAKKL